MGELEAAVHAVIHDCMGVRDGEQVLVVCSEATEELARRLADEARGAGAEALLLSIAERTQHGEEPPGAAAAAMAAADVVLIPTLKSLSHTAARREACAAGARIATFPGVTAEMLARVMSGDLAALRRRSRAVAERLSAAGEARITCPRGSDLRLSLRGREAIADGGELHEPGAFGNLPCGEGFIAPRHDEGGGTLVVDGTIGGIGVPAEPVRLRVEEGRLVEAEGTEGERLLAALSAAGELGTCVAELGIGTNERAQLTGNLLEDEKIIGTCHVAFGASAGIGGEVQVPVHLDCVVMKPTVELDGEVLVRDGELVV
jgi:leucyl aminopeptidase (aminopeptidase T)